MRQVAALASDLLGHEGAAQFRWSPAGDLLAAAGTRRKKVVLFNRAGEVVAGFTVPDPEFLYDESNETPVVELSWHSSGSHLAVLPRGHSFAMVWCAATRETARVDGGITPVEATAMAWCPGHASLALGTAKGTGVIFDCVARTTVPISVVRNSKPVTCIAWSSGGSPGGLLALGCKGGALMLCHGTDGSLARSLQLKGAVSQLQFCGENGEADGASSGSGSGSSGAQQAASASSSVLLSANVGRRAVCIWQLPQALVGDVGSSGHSSAGPFELAFREGYGELEHYCFVHRRLIVAGFSTGQIVAVSISGGLTPGAGSGTELFSLRCLQHAVAGMSWCARAGMLAAGGGTQLAVLSCQEQEVALDAGGVRTLQLEGEELTGLQYSPDGKLLTVGATPGRLLQYLAAPALLHSVRGTSVAYMDPGVALHDVLLVNEPQSSPVALPLSLEPELLALGPTHLAAAAGNKVCFQAVQPDASTSLLPPPVEAEYPMNISWLQLNASCVLMLGEGGRVFVQPAPGASGDVDKGEVVELRSEEGETFAVSCAALTDHFILLGLPDGKLAFYECAGGCALIDEFEHAGGGITAAFPSADGTLVIFQDTAGGVFLYNAVRGELMHPPDFQGDLGTAVWDSSDTRVLAAVNSEGTVHVYCHIPVSVQGPGVKLVGTQAGPKGSVALALQDGMLTWHQPDGGLVHELLDTHQHLSNAIGKRRGSSNSGSRASSRTNSLPGPQQLLGRGSVADMAAAAAGMSREEYLGARCQQALALCHFKQALEAACCLGDSQVLGEVAVAALQFLELPTAVAAYEAAGDKQALEQLRALEGMQHDENLLTGHVTAMTGGDADRAEQLLLASSRPSAAIEMRKHLGHWERALALAEHLEPQSVGAITMLRAGALEAEGQVEAALGLYQQAMQAPDLAVAASSGTNAGQRHTDCQAGIARCTILLGDVERGMELAATSRDAALLAQCAELLESQQHIKQAGQLYEMAGQYERAAQLFLHSREFALLDGVMAHAGSPALWLQYAQTKEDLGSFAEAAHAYEQSGDLVAAVRVLLQRLEDAESAAELANRADSTECSLMVARSCELSGKHQVAVQQYCQAGDFAAAFALAQRAGCVPALADWARQKRNAEAALLAAGFFEAAGQLVAAAELCALAGKHERAARLYIQAGGDSLPAAIKLASEAGSPEAAAVVVEHLQAVDGMGAALVDLHLALGNVAQACAVAEARARHEQAEGNYKAARDQLLQLCLELRRRGASATPSLLSTLHLVHSYLLVRTLVRQSDHAAAARLLLRVADGIAAFPKHAVSILTSTVIECHRAGLHGHAQRWAATLQQPPYAGQVSQTYSKKIEAIARQPAWTESSAGEGEPLCDCIFCGAPGPEIALSCTSCQRMLPFCAASGKRMAMNDWSECPSCRFPCRGRDMTRAVVQERCCLLCEAAVGPHDIKKIFDPVSQLRKSVFASLLRRSSGGHRT